MANSIKVKGSNVTTSSAVSVYTVPSLSTAVVLSLTVCNTHTAAIVVTVSLFKGGSTEYKICNQMAVAQNATLSAIGDGQKLSMEAGDVLKVSTFTGPCDAVLSYIEVA